MLANILDHDSGFILLKCVATLSLNVVIKGKLVLTELLNLSLL